MSATHGPGAGPVLALLRPLLLVVACLSLMGTGGVELAPRPAGAAPAVSVLATATSRADAPAGPRTDATPPRSVLRAALAAASAPTSGGAALPPASGPLVAPHLVSDPQSRPPTRPDLAAPRGPAEGRAPPRTTGT